jgi:hypothetical protein
MGGEWVVVRRDLLQTAVEAFTAYIDTITKLRSMDLVTVDNYRAGIKLLDTLIAELEASAKPEGV